MAESLKEQKETYSDRSGIFLARLSWGLLNIGTL